MRFLLGDWAVDPASNSLSRGEERRQVEPRAMQVLEALSAQPGTVLSAEQLLARCWPEEPAGDNPVHKTVAQLRRALDDSATEPRYIETIRKRGYRVVAAVRSAAEGAAPQARRGGWRGGSPFRGLQAFDARHAEVFFGREQALQQLLARVRAQWQQRRAFMLLLGASGSGKTSLVLAGLFPALQGLSATTLDLGDIGAHAPLAGLAAALLDWEIEGRGLFPGASAEALAQSLARTPEAVLGEIGAARRGHTAPLLLFVDRLEALFVAPHIDAAARQAFLDALQALADSGELLVVAACRNDFYPQLAEHELLMRDKGQGGHFDLAPPTRAEIAQMIRLPASAAGLSFGFDAAGRTRLDDQLCDDAAHSPDALPLLQYTLEELYRRRTPHGELGFEAYRELGGLEGAIGRRAEDEIAALLPIQQQALPRVLALLVMLPGEGLATTGRRALWRELGGPAERELVQALVDARLLVSDLSDDQQAGFRVAHEALLRRWPRVTEWIDQHRQALQLRSRLRQQVQRWLAEGRANEYLLPKGKQLVEAGDLLERHPGFALSADERAFVQASQQRAARGERLRISAIIGLALLAVLSASLAWRADRAERLARQRSAEAEDLLGYMLGDFADKLRPIGRLALLDSVGSKALDHLAAGGDGANAQARLQRAKALTVIGEVRVSQRELDAALEPLRQARQLLQGEPPTGLALGDWRKAQGAAAFWMGHVHYIQRQFAPARRAMEDYARYSADWLSHAPGQHEALLESSYAQNSLGTLMMDSGDLGGAERQFRGSAALKRQLLGQKPQDLTLKGELADSLSWLGRTLVWQGQFAQALPILAEAVELIEAVRRAAPQDLVWVYREATLRYGLAEAQGRLGHGAELQAELGAAGRLLSELLRIEPDNQRWRALQLSTAVALEEAQARPRLEAVQRLLARIDELEGRAGAGVRLQLLPLRARALQLREAAVPPGRPQDAGPALAALGELLARLQQASRSQPEDLKLRTALASLRLTLRTHWLQQQRPEPAREQCAALLAELEELRPFLRVHYDITRAWVEAHSCLGRSDEAAGERDWLQRSASAGAPS